MFTRESRHGGAGLESGAGILFDRSLIVTRKDTFGIFHVRRILNLCSASVALDRAGCPTSDEAIIICRV